MSFCIQIKVDFHESLSLSPSVSQSNTNSTLNQSPLSQNEFCHCVVHPMNVSSMLPLTVTEYVRGKRSNMCRECSYKSVPLGVSKYNVIAQCQRPWHYLSAQ